MELSPIVAAYPLSPLQQGMLFHHLYGSQFGVDIEQMVMRLPENLNISAFEYAWQRIVERHPVLRTSFEWVGLDQPRQRVFRQVNLRLDQQDWQGLPAQAQEDWLANYLQADRQRGFELTEAPLMRLALFRRGEADYQCVWTFHHILLDGRSLAIILRELFAFYEAFCRNEHLHLEPLRPYQDYIEWWQQQNPDQAEVFWRNQLESFTKPTSLTVDRRFDHEIEAPKEYAAQEIRLTETTSSSLQTLAQHHGVTLNTFVQGAWALLLSRYSRETDVVFGVTRTCRRSTIAGTEAMVGLFINTLPLVVRVPGEMPLLPWLKELRAQNLALREAGREHTPLVKVQEWSAVPRGLPLFESLLVFENYDLNASLQAQGGAWANRTFGLLEQTNYPLTVNGYLDSTLRLKIGYSRHRFDDQTIGRMLGHLKTLLESMAIYPGQKLAALPMLTEAELQQLSGQRATGSPPLRSGLCLHQYFERQATHTPEAIALSYEQERLTYRQLNQQANQVAHYLQRRGVGPGSLVGLFLERSPEMVVTILGVLKAGGAYVPLDLAYPPERLAFILQDTQTPVIVTVSDLVEKLPSLQTPIICLDTAKPMIAQESVANPVSPVEG
ncbi:MAG: AMP-binding protein, partial [Anaerolineales bacterium]|nr:AMP-binding protein [Anaerolineales bacterium]